MYFFSPHPLLIIELWEYVKPIHFILDKNRCQGAKSLALHFFENIWLNSHFLFAWTKTNSFLRQKSVSEANFVLTRMAHKLQICSTDENSSANKLHLKPTAPLYYTFRGFSVMDCYTVRSSTKYVMHIFAFFHFIRILVSVEEKREELSSIMVTFQHCVKCIQ